MVFESIGLMKLWKPLFYDRPTQANGRHPTKVAIWRFLPFSAQFGMHAYSKYVLALSQHHLPAIWQINCNGVWIYWFYDIMKAPILWPPHSGERTASNKSRNLKISPIFCAIWYACLFEICLGSLATSSSYHLANKLQWSAIGRNQAHFCEFLL